jgi:hypothetical protein
MARKQATVFQSPGSEGGAGFVINAGTGFDARGKIKPADEMNRR